jgi:hypothetical protein
VHIKENRFLKWRKIVGFVHQQVAFLTKDNYGHVLMTSVESPTVAATWNNNIQALVEGIGMGIPSNNSSDPRNGAIKMLTMQVPVALYHNGPKN